MIGINAKKCLECYITNVNCNNMVMIKYTDGWYNYCSFFNELKMKYYIPGTYTDKKTYKTTIRWQ